jgi:UDP-glucose 4-epimerase
MNILLTGGSGDLGQLAIPTLNRLGHSTTNLDLRPTTARENSDGSRFVQGSLMDRDLLSQIATKVDCVVHIAALHGIHEFRGDSNRNTFWDFNVTGTFNVLQAAVEADIRRIIFISSTTAIEPSSSWYGHTKYIAEETCRSFTIMHPELSIICLRPRAFIPHWNRDVYESFPEWARWFWAGAVHINDVEQAVIKSVQLLESKAMPGCQVFIIDGKHDYSAEDLADWDLIGPGSTFKKYYGDSNHELAVRHGLDPAKMPLVLDSNEAKRVLGYEPTYSLRNLLEELKQYDGPGE